MGFWSWLAGKPKTVTEVDIIWLNDQARFQNLVNEIREKLASHNMVPVVCHFPATIARLREQLEPVGVVVAPPEKSWRPADLMRALNTGAPPQAMVMQAGSLLAEEFADPVDETLPGTTILVAERHLLRSHDDGIVNFARSLGRHCQVRFHVSLDDPLMRTFAGDWVAATLQKMGMTESDPIESDMVARRVRAAQAKLAQTVTAERKADSAEEWLRLNVPE